MRSEVEPAGVSLIGTTGVSKLRSTLSMAVPHLARKAFVDPSGRRKELVWALPSLNETRRGWVHIGDSG
jgi:hypothetical protein